MSIKTINHAIEQQARNHQDRLTKPPGALGRLEDIACWFATRQEKTVPDLLQPHIAVFAADHGVTTEGISAFPAVVTTEMVKNFASGGAAINVLAKQASATLSIVDVGVLFDVTNIKGVTHAKVRQGTSNLLSSAAMTTTECEQAIAIGRHEAKQAIQQGANVLIAGDMGIGNTTASACLISLFTHQQPESIVGRGTGIDDNVHKHKISIVKQALQRLNTAKITPDNYLQEVGGLEIAAICGFYLEAATQGVPMIIDGFIASAAALAAQHIEPNIHHWMLASHTSEEHGHRHALQQLGLQPFIHFNMRLGEGSGAALVIPLFQSAILLHRDMATFESAGVSDQ